MKKNLFSIGKKQVRVPIVQGGMGVGISLGRLAGTVAKEGGAGTISAAQIGFKEPDFYENPIEANKRAIHKEQLEEFTPDIYGEEVKKIITVVQKYEEKYEKKIPVILAGGIYDHADYERAFSLGADGVQIATRFVTTEECDADEHYKQTYIQAEKEDIVIVKSPVGMPGRAIRNTFLDKVKSEGRIPPTKCLRCIHTCNPAETPYCITEALIHAAKGETENALLFCGGRAYEAKTIETVKKVIDYFCSSCI